MDKNVIFSEVKSGRMRIAALLTITAMLIFSSCDAGKENSASVNQGESKQAFQSKNVNGQWTTDRNTAMELRAMQSSIVNFNLLIKKQPQNLNAYRGYADVLQNHLNRTLTYCSLDQNAKSLLCKDLNKLKEQIDVIEYSDINKAREAASNISSIFAHIDSLFDFDF